MIQGAPWHTVSSGLKLPTATLMAMEPANCRCADNNARPLGFLGAHGVALVQRSVACSVPRWAAGLGCVSGTVAHHVAPHLTLDLEQLARLLFLRKSNIAAARCGGMDRHRITWQRAVPPGTV